MKILLITFCIFLVGCMKEPGNQVNVDYGEQKDPFEKVLIYGQEVYYFKYLGADFGNTLAAFLKKHSDIEVASMTLDITDQGGPRGYFVVFRQKKKC